MAFTSNKIFYIGALLFVTISLVLYAQGDHGDAIIWFAERRSDLLNLFFINITKVGEAWSFVLLLVVLLFYRIRHALMVFVLAILVPAISLSTKKFFSCPRPGKYFKDVGLLENVDFIEGIKLYTGNTSFPSGHTMAAFAVTGFAAFVFAKYKWSSFSLIILAILVAISRVYLSHHFLVDVCAGATIGCLIALFASWLSIKIQGPKAPWMEKNLLTFKKESPKV